MAIHSSFLAWRIPWTREPGRLQPMELQRVRHDRGTNTLLINNVVVFSGEHQRDSAIHVHVSILARTSLPSRLLLNTEQFHVLYNRSLVAIHFKYSSVYMSILKSLTISSFSKYVSLFLFCN